MHRLIRFLCVFLSLCLLTAAGVTVAATVRLERYARAAEESPPVIPDLRGPPLTGTSAPPGVACTSRTATSRNN